MHLENSSAVVTGGASGLGLATVQALLARGVLVTILDLPTSQGAQVAESLGAAASFAPGDVRDDEAVAAAVALADGRAPLRTLGVWTLIQVLYSGFGVRPERLAKLYRDIRGRTG